MEKETLEETKVDTIEKVEDKPNAEQEKIEQELTSLQQTKKKKKKGKLGRIIGNLIFTVIVLVIAFEAIVGIVNMKKINEGEEPVWYLSSEKQEEATKVVTKYNLGLYRIVKTDTDKDTRIVLKPFFIED